MTTLLYKHPKIGELTGKIGRSKIGWRGEINIPAFDAFAYRVPNPRGKYPLTIDGDKDETTPSEEAVTLASRLVTRQEEVVQSIAKAFWEELHGRGPSSGMYWYDGLKDPDVGRLFQEYRRAEDIFPLMRLTDIYVRNDVDGVSGYVTHLFFAAVFEEEHDVGVLTDGASVLGTGYSTDVTPYGFEY